jgi:Na+-translocating ferredoxin:NAD+ oxidoreductase RNF subunit RnfB
MNVYYWLPSVTAIGIICAVILAIASKVMAVQEDEKFTKIRECLPGANCGACGYTGCDGYAHALAEEEGVKTNLCVPGADNVSRQLSELMGVAFEDVVEQVAVVTATATATPHRTRWSIRAFSPAPRLSSSSAEEGAAPSAVSVSVTAQASARRTPSALKTASPG